MAEMGKFNEELIKAGMVLSIPGLQPRSKGARVKFSGKNRTVIDGPFTEAKELIAGFWIWQVKSLEEAIEWVKRAPNSDVAEYEIEIRGSVRWRTSQTSCLKRRSSTKKRNGLSCHFRPPSNRRQCIGLKSGVIGGSAGYDPH